jgi:hypothetical protein
MPRLPVVDSDTDTWGQILNDFLGVSHNTDGSLNVAALIKAGRSAQMVSSFGYAGETFLPNFGNTQVAPTSQSLYGCGIFLHAGEIITNLYVNVSTAGAGTTPTTIRMGIMNSSRVVQAVTADVHADSKWTSTGVKQFALTAPWTVPTDGIYYILFLQNGAFGTTAMQMIDVAVVAGSGVVNGTNPPRFGIFGTTVTDIPAVGASAAAWSSTTKVYWMAFN